MTAPEITKNYMENIHRASVLLRLFFSQIVFAIIWNFVRTVIKNFYVGLLLFKKHTN